MGHRDLGADLYDKTRAISVTACSTLAARELIVIRRTPGGKADALDSPAEGRKRASEIV
jgi:hypothetical protein